MERRSAMRVRYVNWLAMAGSVAAGVVGATLLSRSKDSTAAELMYSSEAQSAAERGRGSNLIAAGVMSPFTTPFKLSFFAALLIAMPYVIYQLWSFVAPGLYRHERRFAVPLLISAILLFYVGIAFAYYFVFPVMFEFFVHTTPKGVTMMTDINHYLDFVLTMFFCFGLAFEVPVAVVLLVLMGMVRIESLKKNRGYVLIGIFILAALLTPPDAISQCSLAIPMYFLYEGGIIMARILSRMKREDSEK